MWAPRSCVEVLVYGEVGERLVHDYDDRGLLLAELLRGGRALDARSLAGIVLRGVLVDEVLGKLGGVASGLRGWMVCALETNDG